MYPLVVGGFGVAGEALDGPDIAGGVVLSWYFKVTLGSDPLTGKRVQITKRGYRTASAAGRERR